LRQFANRTIPRYTIFTTNLALHFAFTQRVRASQHPAEHRIVLWRRSLRMSEANQIRVRPTIALLILHGLVRQIVGLAADIPTAYCITQTATPTAQSIHIFCEVEQVRANSADLAEVLECQSLAFSIAVGCHQCH